METYIAKFEPIVAAMGIEITSIRWLNQEMLEVLIAYQDFRSMDLDTVTAVARQLSEAIDYEVALDVSSAGAERLIAPHDYERLLNRFVRVRFIQPLQDSDYVEGELIDSDDDSITIAYRVLHATKTINIERNNIATLHLAVKL